MNQTVTVNISGMVFHIEVDAYDTLKNYLSKIKGFFRDSDESAEIMADIEARIAELFNGRLSSKNQVIVAKDVMEVIAIMGKPEQFADEDDTEPATAPAGATSARRSRRIFRDPEDRVIGGVASGLGAYFGVEPVWIRLAWAISVLFFGFGFLLYIILWIIIPKARTASDKLEMKGEAVNFKNIGKTFEEEAERVRDNFKKMDQKGMGNKIESAFRTCFNLIGVLLKGLFKVMGKVLGLILLFAGLFMGFFFIAGFGSTAMFSVFSDHGGLVALDMKNAFVSLLGSDNQFEFTRYALMGLIGIPILGLIYGSMRLLFNFRGNSAIGGGLAALWFICLITIAVMGAQVGSDFSNRAESRAKFPVNSSFETLYLELNDILTPGVEILSWDEDRFLSIDDSMIYHGYPLLDVIASRDDSTRLLIRKSAHGGSRNKANLNADAITYRIAQVEDKVIFDPYFSFKRNDHWRAQELDMVLELPVGKAVYFHPSLENVIYDIDNTTDTWDLHMLGKTWVMTSRGLACTDCNE